MEDYVPRKRCASLGWKGGVTAILICGILICGIVYGIKQATGTEGNKIEQLSGNNNKIEAESETNIGLINLHTDKSDHATCQGIIAIMSGLVIMVGTGLICWKSCVPACRKKKEKNLEKKADKQMKEQIIAEQTRKMAEMIDLVQRLQNDHPTGPHNTQQSLPAIVHTVPGSTPPPTPAPLDPACTQSKMETRPKYPFP